MRATGWAGLLGIGCYLGASAALAAPTPSVRSEPKPPVYIEPGPTEKSVLYADGREIDLPTKTVWRPICGSDLSQITVDDLRRGAERARQDALAHPYRAAEQNVVAGGAAKFDLVFNFTTAVPAEAVEALAACERYIEAQFSDPVTVVIDFSFVPIGGAILGQTSSSTVFASWTNTRIGLQTGMDLDDTIQSFLPPGATIPIRYNGTSDTVTDEDRVIITRANYRATIGTIGGTTATMQMNSNFNWDYTPPNIEPGRYCFQSVIIHEVGHALGFISAVDSETSDMYMLDIYRFQRSDGASTDYNPDDLTEFTNHPRLIAFNSPFTNDDSNSDLITVEYQMSDGQPYQASHFSELTPSIYRMDPILVSEETFYPNFYRIADTRMLDAIGWDYPPENTQCPSAIPLECGEERHFDTQSNSLTPTPSFSCGSGSGHLGTMWYRFTASSTAARISTCGSDGDDSTLAVYGGTCGQLVEVGCAEDGGCSTKPGLSTLCLTGLQIGETYFVQVSSRAPASQNIYTIRYDCACPGACCLPPPTDCIVQPEDACLQLGGAFAGSGTDCLGDGNADSFDDACEQSRVLYFQLPTAAAEDSASNLDASDFTPQQVVTDGVTSDGRPVHSIRWWGSVLDALVVPDGFLVGFFEPLVETGPAAAPLGLYYCDAPVVGMQATPIPACDPHAILSYETRLHDCCLVESNMDSRSGATPAQREAFNQELCLDYELSIQAITGRRYDRDIPSGQCIASPTAGWATGNFWGWHRTALGHGSAPTLVGPVVEAGGWTVGPMSALVTGCGPSDAAFELLTTTPAGQSERVLWDNGPPAAADILGSQFGGQETDWMTVDDVDFPNGATIENISFFSEEEPPYSWAGRVRLEIYPDNGALSPDESGGPFAGLWIPNDAGAVTRTSLGPGVFFERTRYDITGLNLVLPPGRWWIGLAGDGGVGGTGRTFWAGSHSVPPQSLLIGGEAHTRSATAGLPQFAPWSLFLNGRQPDTAFSVSLSNDLDCNCNAVNDADDIALLTSLDCNTNGIPDECEYDCNGNNIPDDCDLSAQTSADCQANDILDECEIFLGSALDADDNGIPDLCCEPVAAPTPAGSSNPRNRTLGIQPGNAGRRVALRVRLVSLQHPNPPNPPSSPPRDFSEYENTYRWVGPPGEFPEGVTPTPSFKAAKLQCTPYFADWGGFPLIFVYGPEVMPSSVYEIQTIEEDCDTAELLNYSPILQAVTSRWGDVVDPLSPPSESVQPDSLDVVSLVNKFRNQPGSPIKAAAKLQPALIDFSSDVGALDIVSTIDGFRGSAYPYQGLSACPP